MKSELKEGKLVIFLEGKIDSVNVDEVEKELRFERDMVKGTPLVLDAEALQYISSAGLRMLLRLKKEQTEPLPLLNVSDGIFDILSTTGFTEILEVYRPMREVSIQGCPEISGGLNGTFYELTNDEMIKVYGETFSLAEAQRERELAGASLGAGIPTLIPYDVVRCGSRYGIVFEKTNSRTLLSAAKDHPSERGRYAKLLAHTLREIHATKADHAPFPDIRDLYAKWMEEAEGLVDRATLSGLNKLIELIPDSNTYVNGNLGLSNMMLDKNEILLLDMAGSAFGHPIFDLQSLYAYLVMIPKANPGYSLKAYGMSNAVCAEFWDTFFGEYLESKDGATQEKMKLLLTKCYSLKEKLLSALEEKHRGS